MKTWMKGTLDVSVIGVERILASFTLVGNAIRVLKVDNTPQLELSTNCDIRPRSTR